MKRKTKSTYAERGACIPREVHTDPLVELGPGTFAVPVGLVADIYACRRATFLKLSSLGKNRGIVDGGLVLRGYHAGNCGKKERRES